MQSGSAVMLSATPAVPRVPSWNRSNVIFLVTFATRSPSGVRGTVGRRFANVCCHGDHHLSAAVAAEFEQPSVKERSTCGALLSFITIRGDSISLLYAYENSVF